MGSTRPDKPSKEDEKRARKRHKKDVKHRKPGTADPSATTGAALSQDQREKEENGLLTRKRIRLNASILPSGLADVKASVDRCIRDFLLKYSDSIGGIIMAYDNVNIKTNGKGRIVEELPHIHHDVTCDALVFTPILKAQLKGRVTGSFHSHIAVVAFNFFNASISAAHLRQAGFEYDVNKEMWYETDSEYVIEKGSSIKFAIEKVHEAGE